MSYSEEETREIIGRYVAEPTRETVEELAEQFGKPIRSIIAKLAASSVYQNPKRTTKTGDPIVKKEELVEEIGEWLNIEVPTLVKTGKVDLKKLHSKIAEVMGVESDG